MANEEKKTVLRQALIAQRRALPEHEWVARSRAIQLRALHMPAYAASRSVALYSAMQREVATDEILATALAEGRRVFYPRIVAHGAGHFVRVTHAADLRTGRYGILEPVGAECLAEKDLNSLIVFIPGIAFDGSGNRLGLGWGWYDRIVPALGDGAALVALAYDFQVVAKVPTENWDRKVHWIVTETKLVDCSAANAPLSQAL